ncbi:iron ABC transporter permease [Meridianimarinicoccus sp. MJW13]|uniref:ABC transporter permease n=1 Tax=Meridianimarinicoccus sp. MJW13 TaxID=2720031 RepID=UPI001865D8C4|nr:iron ABC transporter permease [Fluviibacterium sp. MJW13]
MAQALGMKIRRAGIDVWSVGALVVAAVVAAPLIAVGWLALTPGNGIWMHLWSTTLPRYLSNTLFLMIAVGLTTAVTGTVTAWLITMYRFPGARWLEWLLLLPLAIPAYIGAYALTDLLEYAGPVQTGLRSLFGWSSSRDYWFPEVRSRGAAVLVLGAALYPYVYLLARAAFREQSVCAFDVARTLGAGPVRRFFRIGLPLARPAIAAGTAIAMMETVSDFGVVEYFAVQTLTTGIFTTWLEAGNPGGAAQIAIVILTLVFFLVGLEKSSRRRSRFFRLSRQQRPLQKQSLTGLRAWIATVVCAAPVLGGFGLPISVIGLLALRNAAEWKDPALLQALGNTLLVGGSAAILTVSAALFMVYGVRLSGNRLPRTVLPVTTLGYAAPGAVLGLGILMPLAAVDHRLADLITRVTGHDPGLLLTGSAFAVVLAYAVRFFAIAQGAADSALGRVSPSLPMAARSLGRTAGGTLRHVHLPIISGSIGTALLLVFVDSVKELPATLLLRPFNFDTLATRVYGQASLERIGDAAPPAMLVIGVGLAAVLVLARSNK